MKMPTAVSKEFLENLYRTHHRIENLDPDPLLFARGFDDPAEGETAGLIAAGFAYGRVEKIVETLGRIFAELGPSPRRAILTEPPQHWSEVFADFAYRFHKGPDLALFLLLLRRAVEKHGSLRALFEEGDRGDQGEALSAFSGTILGGDCRPILRTRDLPHGHPVRHLLASPATGGAAKRLCLYLRWMSRRDALDPGYWLGAVDPARLVVPLDTHVARVGRQLGFTGRSASDWKTAREITEGLRRFDPADPLRYDFSLFRYGMGQ